MSTPLSPGALAAIDQLAPDDAHQRSLLGRVVADWPRRHLLRIARPVTLEYLHRFACGNDRAQGDKWLDHVEADARRGLEEAIRKEGDVIVCGWRLGWARIYNPTMTNADLVGIKPEDSCSRDDLYRMVHVDPYFYPPQRQPFLVVCVAEALYLPPVAARPARPRTAAVRAAHRAGTAGPHRLAA